MWSSPSRCVAFTILVCSAAVACSAAFLCAAAPGAEAAAADAPQEAWLSDVQRRIAEEEYRVTWQPSAAVAGLELPAGWQAPNRAHGLRTYFTADGVHVVPRTEAEPSWHLALSLVGYGRANDASPVGRARLSTHANRVDYDRGPIVEWYVNDGRGLEQGFTLSRPPGPAERTARAASPASAATPRSVDHVVLVLALGGPLSPVVGTQGQAVDFVEPNGRRVARLTQLRVSDARGRELRAWMEGFAEAGSRGLRIVFDERGASYPVTVDPLLTGPAWSAESNQSGAAMGWSVSGAGDVNGDGYGDVIVGVRLYDGGESNEGRALVYLGSAAGLSADAAWSAEGNQAEAKFGSSVSTAGDVNGDGYADVIVGAPDAANGEPREGRAWVYHGSPAGPGGTAAWTGESNQPYTMYGQSVATAGDVNGDGYGDVIVGAPGYDNGPLDEGWAFVYYGSAGGLGGTAGNTVEGNSGNAQLGQAVATAGDVDGDGFSDVIVGAPYFTNGELEEGAAFVFRGSAAGLVGGAAWTVEGGQAGANLGAFVSTAGDVNGDGYSDVAVGAPRFDKGETDEGRVTVYHGSPTGPGAAPAWTGEGNQTDARYGTSAATAGDVNGDGYADIVVGAPNHDHGETDEGLISVYLGSAVGLHVTADWTAEGNANGAKLGQSVATAGDVNGDGYSDVIAGASSYSNGESGEGRAVVYHGSPSGLRLTAGWTADGNQAGANFGASVAAAGDVNGDGFGDVIVGAGSYDNGHVNEGRAFMYLGAADGPALVPAWTAEGNQANAYFGDAVAAAGDVNGDGYDDVVVGAGQYSNGSTYEGRAFVYHGWEGGLDAVPAWTAESNQAYAYFGSAVSSAGDVNGDGYADVIVGAEQYANGETGEGRAFVFHGSASGLSPLAAWTAESNQANAYFGSAVSAAGDVNGDGYDDVVVGAYMYDGAGANEGRAYVYHGSSVGLGAAADWAVGCGQAGGNFGRSVAGAGDVNGDGYADVLVGAPLYTNAETNEGRAMVYLGSTAGLAATPAWTAEPNQAGASFGSAVAGAGDVNGDGYADVIVAAANLDNGAVDEGRVQVFHGSAAGLGTTASWTAEGDQASAHFGSGVSSAGDVNGDGYADVIVGAADYDAGEPDEGRASIFFGNEGPGALAPRPQQRRYDDGRPISIGGRSRDSRSFRLAAVARSPFGRGRGTLEWEIKLLGWPFDGLGTQIGPYTDVLPAGTPLNAAVHVEDPGPLHWRVRLRYDPATTPLQGWSRWITVPSGGAAERDLTVSPFIGGTVWEDRTADGIMSTDEPRLAGVRVLLLDAAGVTRQVTVSGGDGGYRFDVGSGGMFRLRFEAPKDWAFTMPDQEPSDTYDSDADTVTGETALIVPPFWGFDETRWSAGLRRVGLCTRPDEPVYLYRMTLTADGNAYPVLHFQDPNQPGDVTGYNVYRTSSPGLPHYLWSRVADDVVDMDAAEPNKQWVDTTGDVPPGGVWYYSIAAYNHGCPADYAEGPW